MKIVVVESPSKAKIIQKYLGDDYKVISSSGHIRELPSKDGSVSTTDFSMTWVLTDKGELFAKEMKKLSAQSDEVVLATDPDREGEGIAWHISEISKSFFETKKSSNSKKIVRISFNAVTKQDILNAIKCPREIDMHLVDAYKTRLRIDYIFGFKVSPILWKKLPGSKSAGRVQSVALRLLVERAKEIASFKSEEYWTIDGIFDIKKAIVDQKLLSEFELKMRLIQYKENKLDKLDIKNSQQAEEIANYLKSKQFIISEIEDSETKRHPNPPFSTSTLQQAAVNELGMRAVRVMRIAQELYEGMDINGEMSGLITYMRTDSIAMSDNAISECRKIIPKYFGNQYLSPMVRTYKTKAKNAQEAHEAIRPTDFSKHPDSIKKFLSEDHFLVYEMIWKRAVASQMASAILISRNIKVKSDDNSTFSATGSKIVFDGFYILYLNKSNDTFLPDVNIQSNVDIVNLLQEQHFTKPPANYTEASLVKKLEEIGVGRPSTYARIFQVLIDREYALYEGKAMIPHIRGILVTYFLMNFFSKYVEYDFTAQMEESLDNVSDGTLEGDNLISKFWTEFAQCIESSNDIKISEVLTTLQKELSIFLFPNGDSDKICPKCNSNLELKLGRFSPFIGCENYINKTCSYVRSIDGETKDGHLGEKDGWTVEVMSGPYGKYLKFSHNDPNQKEKNISLAGISGEINLEQAIFLKNLPILIGEAKISDDISSIYLCTGRFGPYVKHGTTMASLKKSDSIFEISLERAIELLEEKKSGKPIKVQKSTKKTAKTKTKDVIEKKTKKTTSRKKVQNTKADS